MEPTLATTNAAKRWQRHIFEQQRSGLNIAAYCREHKLTVGQFYAWQRKFKLADNPPSPQRFVPVTLAVTPPNVELTLPNGIVVKLPMDTDVSLVTRFITAVTSC